MAKPLRVSQKGTSKRKGGIPLDQLLAAHGSGDDARLASLQARYADDVVPASTLLQTAPVRRKPKKKSANNNSATRSGFPDDLQATQVASPRLVGYARVSTDEQTTALQLDALRAAGCSPIFEDSASGTLRSRPGLDRAIAEVSTGETLVVWRLDRLGRSLLDLLELTETLKQRDIGLRSLSDHIDISTAAGRMLYAVLGAVAQFEREVMRERTVAAMHAAKNRGEHIGRPYALTTTQIRHARKLVENGDSAAHVARVLGVSRSTIYRIIDT